MGRPPKSGDRTPSGQLSRAKGKGQPTPQRIREAVHALAADTTFGTALGRLYLFGRLADENASDHDARNQNEMRYRAGMLFAEHCKAADSVQGFDRYPKAQDMTRTGGASIAVYDATRADRDRKTLSRYYAAEVALGVTSPESRVVREVVEKDATPDTHEGRLLLRRGLARLVEHYRGRI